jgi:hypothetical protein
MKWRTRQWSAMNLPGPSQMVWESNRRSWTQPAKASQVKNLEVLSRPSGRMQAAGTPFPPKSVIGLNMGDSSNLHQYLNHWFKGPYYLQSIKTLEARPHYTYTHVRAPAHRCMNNICARKGIAPMDTISEYPNMIDVMEHVRTHSEMHSVPVKWDPHATV